MTLRPTILSLMKNGVPIDSFYEGMPFTYGDSARDGWEDGEYKLVRAVDIGPSKQSLLEHASQKRWELEVGGIYVGNIPIATDDRSKIMISGARVAAMEDDDFTTPWVTSDGDVVTLDAQTIILVSNAVLSHVSLVFELYSEVVNGIMNGDITSDGEVENAFIKVA